MTLGRLGLIGSGDSKKTSGIYSPDDNVSKEKSKGFISNFSYDGVFNALTSSGVVEGICFSRDGTRLYTATRGTRTTAKLTQWNLSLPFDLTTLSYQSGKDLIVGDWELNSNCLFINNDGTKLFFGGYGSDAIWSVTLATPYDLSTATVDVKKVYVGAQDATANTPVFGDSGTKLYVLGATNKTVYQYTLTTAYDVTTATYSNKSYNVNTQDTAPQGVFFSTDGSKMYIIGATTQSVLYYTLSTPWDVSTATTTFISKTYNVATQATTPHQVYIGDNGTKLYVSNGTAGVIVIFQYTLSTPYDVSTATYANKSLNVSTRAANPWGLFFKSDGTKMYVLDNTTQVTYTYTLSTPWDVSTGTPDYTPRSFSVTAQAANPYNTYIGDSGTKMYVLNQATNAVFQYTLSTPYIVTSAVYASKTLAITRDTDCRGLFFKSDGTKMYILGITSDTIYSYTLSTPWDITTGTSDYIPKSFSVNTQAAEPYNTYIGDSGTKMYVLNQATNAVFQYTLSTPYNVTTAVYANKTISVATQETNARGMYFRDNGAKMYIIGVTNNAVFSYTLSTPWDIATAVADYTAKSYLYSTQTANGNDLFIGDNGTKLYVLSGGAATTDTVFQYTLGTAWDITSATYANKSFSVNAQSSSSEGFFFKTDGTKMYVINNGAANLDIIYQYSLSVAWDISTCTYDNVSFNVNSQEDVTTGIYISPDGVNLYVYGQTGDDVNRYTLGTPWAINTATFVTNTAALPEATGQGLVFKSDGTKFYIVGNTSRIIYEYSLTTAWDISSISLTRTLAVGAFDTSPTGLVFKDDGTRLYMLGDTGDRVHEFSMSVPWQLGITGRFSALAEETTCNAIYISPDGTSMYIAGQTGDDVNQYSLSTAWDIATAQYVRVSVNHTEGTATGLYFKSDGTRMYVSGTTLDTVREYTLSTPWNVSTIVFATSFYIGNFDATMNGIHFNPTGTEMYLTGGTNNTIYQLSLSQAWRSRYVTGYWIVSQEEITGYSIYISPDGLNMYLAGGTGADVNQYSLETAWDISTASYVRVSANIGETIPTGLFFKSDGTKMYISGSTLDGIREFNLSTPWDVSTISFYRTRYIAQFSGVSTGIHFSPDGLYMYITGGSPTGAVYQLPLSQAWVSGYITGYSYCGDVETSPTGMYISSDGLNMYVSGTTGDDVNQYLLDTAWDISTANYVRVSVGHGETEPRGVYFSSDGTRMYIAGQTNDHVREFTLATPWNVSSITYVGCFYYGNLAATAVSLYFSPDGTKMYVTNSNGIIYQFSLAVAWRSNTVLGTFSVNNEETAPRAVYFKPDGTTMYLTGQTGDDVNQYTLSTPWDLTTATYTAVSGASGEATPTGVYFRPDGSRMYVIGSTNDTVREFNLSTPWSVTTAVFSRTISVGFETVPSGIYFNDNGTQMYICGQTNDCVYQIELGTPWDVTSAKGYKYVGVEATTMRGLDFSNDGTLMFISDSVANSIRKYTLSTPYVVETATSSQTFTINGVYGLWVADNGLTVYATVASTSTLLPAGGRQVRQIRMTSPNDLTTAVTNVTTEFIPILGLTGASANPWTVFCNPDNTKMFVLSDVVQGIYQFSRRFG